MKDKFLEQVNQRWSGYKETFQDYILFSRGRLKLDNARSWHYAPTQKEFCDKFGFVLRTYQNYENGKTIPSLKEGLRLAKILNMDIEYINELLNKEG